MASIREYLFDSVFLDQSIRYLRDVLGLGVVLLDSEGNVILEAGSLAGPHAAERHYPFSFPHPIGGLTCRAADSDVLARLEPHIAYCLAALDSQLRREIELRETSDEMLQLSSQLNFLHKIARKIIGVNDLEQCYRITLHEIAAAVQADQAFIRTKGRWDQEVRVSFNLDQAGEEAISNSACLRNTGADSTIICAREDGASLLCSHLREKDGQQSGCVVFIRSPGSRPFTAYEKQFVSIIENIISPTFETLRLYDSLQDLYLNTVKALAAAIDAKDEYTHGHSFRVARFSLAIGRQLQLDGQQLNDLEIAAYMHDLGKIGISELILGKPGRLTHEEFCLIQKHPAFTDKILQPIRLPEHILLGAVQHHERLDGSGYPRGLKGEQISLFGRLIAVADVFDAMTSKRPYREAIPVETALKALCDGIDTQFDRGVVLALIRALQAESTDDELQEIRTILQFDAVQHLNKFLRELIEFVGTGGEERARATTAPG